MVFLNVVHCTLHFNIALYLLYCIVYFSTVYVQFNVPCILCFSVASRVFLFPMGIIKKHLKCKGAITAQSLG